MMAKMFYTMEETRTALGKSEEEIKQLSREGRLREFRDGPRLMFKADQVEQIKAELAGGEQVDLGPSDSGIVSVAGGSGAGVTLGDTDVSGRSATGPGIQLRDETGLSSDLGLSGSVGGVPSPGRVGPGGSVGGSGINVFSAGEVEKVDPSAQTVVSSAVSDQVNLEGVGSGSGLLDLTRESDDTSLGAELLDEIAPSGTGKAPAITGGTRAGTRAGISGGSGAAVGLSGLEQAVSAGPVRGGMAVAVPQYVEAVDTMAPAFGAAALAGVLVLLFGGFVVGSAVMGYYPSLIDTIMAKGGLMFVFGISIVATVIFFVIGMFIGKSRR